MVRKSFFILVLLIANLIGFAQQSISDSTKQQQRNNSIKQPIDSTQVSYSPIHFDSIILNAPNIIDTSLFFANDFDALSREKTIYSTLSNTGLAHKSMRHDFSRPLGFDMSLPSYSAFIKTDKEMETYFSVLPYSEIRYVMTTGDKEQHLHFRFGRQFAPRFYLSLGVNTELSPGIFTNCKTNNNYCWINTHYTTKNQRYGISAFGYRDKLEMQENGGIVNDDDYLSNNESDMAVIPTHLNSASNYIKTSGFGFEHYFKLLFHKNQETDTANTTQNTDSLNIEDYHPFDSIASIDTISTEKTIAPSKSFSFGTISHRFNYQRNQLFFNESSPQKSFYNNFDTLINPTATTDSTIIHAIRNELQWNSLGKQKYNDNVPFYIYAGAEYGLFKIKQFDYLEGEIGNSKNFTQLSVKGGIIVNLFKSTKIKGHAQFITMGYQIGDFNVKGQWQQYFGTRNKNFGIANLNLEIKRQSANWFETSYTSNHFRWENDFKASTFLLVDLFYQYKSFRVGMKQTSINNLIYLGLDAHPTQNEGFCNIREAYCYIHYLLWRFEVDGFASFQKASDENVIHLPFFLGKLKLSYSQPVFHKAATLQPSITVQYFSKYYADAYMPALRAFYLQDQVKIGNFPFIDLALSLKVKTANIYVSYSNMFLLTGNHDSFIAPHYPMRNSRIFIGINWRLFN